MRQAVASAGARNARMATTTRIWIMLAFKLSVGYFDCQIQTDD
jgi:hypothetical protein